MQHDSLWRWKAEQEKRRAQLPVAISLVNDSTNGPQLIQAVTSNIVRRLEDEVVRQTTGFFDRSEGQEGAPRFTKEEYENCEMPETIYVHFWERACGEKVLWCLYKLLKAFYAPYFYFLPSCAFFGQYLVPFLMGN